MSPQETVMGSLEDIRNGALDGLNIGWFHVFASGQTILCVHNGPATLTRHPTNAPRITVPGRSFETSVSAFKNRNYLVRDLIRYQMLRGLLPADNAGVKSAIDQGFVKRNLLTKSKSFLTMYARILVQINAILKDKPQFRDDSKLNESRKILSDSIGLIQTRFQWDPSELSAILQECLDDYFVRNVMDS